MTAGGRRHLGAVIGSVAFREEFVKKHVDEWIVEMKCLSEVAKTQPHAAYSAFVHGLTSRWSYIMRTIPNISHLLTPLEDVIHQEFIPSLSGRPASSNVERKIFALPARLGGLGLINPVTCSDRFFPVINKANYPTGGFHSFSATFWRAESGDHAFYKEGDQAACSSLCHSTGQRPRWGHESASKKANHPGKRKGLIHLAHLPTHRGTWLSPS